MNSTSHNPKADNFEKGPATVSIDAPHSALILQDLIEAQQEALDSIDYENRIVVDAELVGERSEVRVPAENIELVIMNVGDLDDASWSLIGDDLQVLLGDGRVVVLEGALDNDGAASLFITLDDGRSVLANSFLKPLLAMPQEVEPSTGTESQHGGGAGFDAIEVAALDGALDPLGGLAPTQLNTKSDNGMPNGLAVGEDRHHSSGNSFTASLNFDPEARADQAQTGESSSVLIDALLNDSDPNPGDSIRITSLNTEGLLGTAVLTADGQIRYDPAGRHEDLGVGDSHVESFTYTIKDQSGASSEARVDVTVNGENDSPRALPDAFTMDEDTTLRIPKSELLSNDFDVDGDQISVVYATDNGRDEFGSGEAWIDSDGFVNFRPDENLNGDTYFRYTIEDEHGARDWQVVRVEVNPVNDAPVGNPDQFTMSENNVLRLPQEALLGNDFDPEGDDFDIVYAQDAGNGDAWIDDQGFVNFRPDADFTGDTYFRYTIADEHGARDYPIARVTVNPEESSAQSCTDDGPACGVYEGNLSAAGTGSGDLPQGASHNDPTPGQTDYWLFHANAGDTVTVTVERSEEDLDPALWIFEGRICDPAVQLGEVIDAGDPGFIGFGDDEFPDPGPWGDPQVAFVAPETGQYTAIVSNLMSGTDTGGDGNFDYQIAVA